MCIVARAVLGQYRVYFTCIIRNDAGSQRRSENILPLHVATRSVSGPNAKS